MCRKDEAPRLHEAIIRDNPLDGTIDVPLQSRLIASRVLTPFPIRRNDSIRDIAAQKALPCMRAVTGAFDIF